MKMFAMAAVALTVCGNAWVWGVAKVCGDAGKEGK